MFLFFLKRTVGHVNTCYTLLNVFREIFAHHCIIRLMMAADALCACAINQFDFVFCLYAVIFHLSMSPCNTERINLPSDRAGSSFLMSQHNITL